MSSRSVSHAPLMSVVTKWLQGSLYWRLTDDSVAKGYPRNIRDDWEGLPNNIDAALTWPDNEKTYFFKGSRYWKFHNDEPEDGYPKSISKGFEVCTECTELLKTGKMIFLIFLGNPE